MLARAQCNGCAECAVEMDNILRPLRAQSPVGRKSYRNTRCGRCCLLLHALKLPQQLAVRR
jgi:hypothetical protein